MRFSVFLVGRSTAPEQDRFVMQSLIDHARQAEDRGFDAVFMPDHHFTGYAPMSSDPFVFAAYLAGQLKRSTLACQSPPSRCTTRCASPSA